MSAFSTRGRWGWAWPALVASVVGLVGCASAPPEPDWKMNTVGAVERATAADLEGRSRLADAEWRQALEATRATARPDRMARIELVRCAVRQAGLALDPCATFQDLAADAEAQDQAYARYLVGQPVVDDMDRLPPIHRPVARRLISGATTQAAADLAGISDPLSRLVAASVLWRAGQADPDVLALAVDTASAMGWRRPLLAWLNVQSLDAERRGDTRLAESTRRRAELLTATAARRPGPEAD